MTDSHVAASNFRLDKYIQTKWNSSSDGSGVNLDFYGSIGTSIAADRIGNVIKSNLSSGTTTIPLYAQYQEIGFTFAGTNYPTFNDASVTSQLYLKLMEKFGESNPELFECSELKHKIKKRNSFRV